MGKAFDLQAVNMRVRGSLSRELGARFHAEYSYH